MRRRFAVAAACTAMAAAACQSIAGLGEFSPQDGASSAGGRGGDGNGAGDGGDGGASSGGGAGDGGAAAGGGASPTASSSSAATTTTTSTGGGCSLDHLVLAEVRTRGPDDGNQDFIEILNPTDAPITLGPAHHVDARGEESNNYGERWRGDGSITIPAGGRALLANQEKDNPLGGAIPDGFYGAGIPDGASVVLYEDDVVLDAVCFSCVGTLADGYVCEGAPFARSASCGEPGDTSVQRRAAGSVDGCADTGDGASDLTEGPATPEGT